MFERDGIVQRTDGLELELTPSFEDYERRSTSPLIEERLGSFNKPYPSMFSGTSRTLPDLVRNDPIDTLVITTKAGQTLPALHSLLPRLSSESTVVLCQNGMGVLEGLLERYWPEDTSALANSSTASYYGTGNNEGSRRPGRPSFVCATTTHGVWRKGEGHFVFAGVGDIRFGVVPNQAALFSIRLWGHDDQNPLLNPQSLVRPFLESHLPLTHPTRTLHNTVSSLLQLTNLYPIWLPLPTLQIAQLQKLAVNSCVNTITAVMGVQNGALVGSQNSKELLRSVCEECANVFSAHLAKEEGRWTPPPPSVPSSSSNSNSAISISSTSQSSSISNNHTPIPQFHTPTSFHPPPPRLPDTHPLSQKSLFDYTVRVLIKTSVNLSSTLQDLLHTPVGTKLSSPSRTEIDFITGYVAALGSRYGIGTPVVNSLGLLVKFKEELMKVGELDQLPHKSSTSSAKAPSAQDNMFKKTARAEEFQNMRRRRRAQEAKWLEDKNRDM